MHKNCSSRSKPKLFNFLRRVQIPTFPICYLKNGVVAKLVTPVWLKANTDGCMNKDCIGFDSIIVHSLLKAKTTESVAARRNRSMGVRVPPTPQSYLKIGNGD